MDGKIIEKAGSDQSVDKIKLHLFERAEKAKPYPREAVAEEKEPKAVARAGQHGKLFGRKDLREKKRD
jgi:hypothetical protein